MRARFALALVPVMAACSSFGADPPPSRVGDAGAPNDAAAADVAVRDAETPAFDIDAGGVCSKPGNSCLTFDDAVAPFGDWTLANGTPPRTMPSASGNGMFVELVHAELGDTVSRIVRTIPKAATRTRVSFSMKLTANVVSFKQLTVAEFLCQGSDADLHGVFVNVSEGNMIGTTLPTSAPFSPGVVPVPKDWARFTFEADWKGLSATLKIDGIGVGGTLTIEDCPPAAPTFELRLGLGSRRQVEATALYDDVVYELSVP